MHEGFVFLIKFCMIKSTGALVEAMLFTEGLLDHVKFKLTYLLSSVHMGVFCCFVN